MLAQGEWMIGRPVPNTYGGDFVEFLDWMMEPDQFKRPTIREARDRFIELQKKHNEKRETAYLPNIKSLFEGENVTPQHSKLSEFRETLPNFFTESKTTEESEFHDCKNELRVDGKPISVDKDGFQGTYIGQLNIQGQFDGRGVLLQKRSLYEGFFKNGQKFGAGREIKLCYGSPFIKVIEGAFADCGVHQGIFTEVHIAISKEQNAKCIVRTYDYKDDIIVAEHDCKVTYADGHVATGKLESMVSIKQ